MTNTETIVNKLAKNHIANIKFAIPARVINVSDLKDGYIDVQPIVDYVHPITRESNEEGVIKRVRVVYPSTDNTTICFPLVQGDTVDLVFQSVNIANFINGDKETHPPLYKSFNNRSDVVAYIGFQTSIDSCMNPNNYTNDFNGEDLNIVHNKKSSNEVMLKFTKSGDVKLISPNKVSVEAKEVDVTAENVNIDSSVIDAKNSLIKTDNDVEVKGISFYKFATQHNHGGVESGSSVTAPPNPI